MDKSPDTSTTSREGQLVDALSEIRDIIEEAQQRDIPEPTIISMATSGEDGQPSVRTVYLSEINEEGLVFFINMNSGKGRQIQENPKVGLCMFWPELKKQVTVEGNIDIMPDAAADELWAHRTRDSQLASWASNQQTSSSEEQPVTEKRDGYRKEFDFEIVPRPDNWKALILHPSRMEFWDTGWNRLRQRRLYSQNPEGSWQVEIENP